MTTFFPLIYYLSCYLLLVVVDALSIIGNGIITLLYFKYANLRKIETLYLLVALSITSLVDALLTVPQLIYFIANWHSTYVNYDAKTVLGMHIVTLVQLKVDLTINSAVAIDRMQAIIWPIYYRQKRQRSYSLMALAIGFSFGAVDILLAFILTTPAPNPGCAAPNCFAAPSFQLYWGLSDMTIGAVGLVCTLSMIVKLRQLTKNKINPISQLQLTNIHNHASTSQHLELKRFKQANKMAIRLLSSMTVCIFIPSVATVVCRLANFDIFSHFGPISIASILFSCSINSFINLSMHGDLRRSLKKMFIVTNGDEVNA